MGFFKNLYEVATGEPWPWEKKTSEVVEQVSTDGKVAENVKKMTGVINLTKGDDGSSTSTRTEGSSSFFSPFNPLSPLCPVNIYDVNIVGSSRESEAPVAVASTSSDTSSDSDDWGGGDDGGGDDWDD